MSARLSPPPDLWEGSAGSVAQLRIPPHSRDSEESVLGGLLLDNEAFDRIGDLLTEEDFYRFENRLIFGSIVALIMARRPADVITVYEHLANLGKAEEVGGLVALNALAQKVPNAANVRRYAEIVRERSMLRKLISTTDEIATKAFNPEGSTVEAIVDEAERKVFAIVQSRNAGADDWLSMEKGLTQAIARIAAAADGNAPDYTPTYFGVYDERLDGGMRGGELEIIGARPSMGKTAFALNIARAVAKRKGLPWAVFSFEMPARQLMNRFLASEARVHLSLIRRPERLRDHHWNELTRAAEDLRPAPIEICDQSYLTITQVRSKARAFARRHGGKIGGIVLDYLSLMPGTDPRMPRAYQLQEITQGLKALAKELDCPVLLLQQISRGVESRDDPMPMMSDLKDAGSIEQDADVITFIHRPIVFDRKLEEINPMWKHVARIGIPKLRDGEPGEIVMYYTGEHLQFADWPIEIEIPKQEAGGGGRAPRRL